MNDRSLLRLVSSSDQASATHASNAPARHTEIDLRSNRLAALEVRPNGYDEFGPLTQKWGGLPFCARYDIDDVNGFVFRVPQRLHGRDDYRLKAGINIRLAGTVPYVNQSKLERIEELPLWLFPDDVDNATVVNHRTPANDNSPNGIALGSVSKKSQDIGVNAPASSDEALALRFVRERGQELRFVAIWDQWLWFDGTRWQVDKMLKAKHFARQTCRVAANECNDLKASKSIASAKTVGAVLSLTKADPTIAAEAEQWDADPWLLNTPGGVVDLRTGKLRMHDPADYMTKITGVTPDTACPTPIWLGFLKRVLGNDVEVIAFVQRVLGYALTGLTQEHALFFLYGIGANGKSTLIAVIINCMGDYHRAAAIETFTDAKNERHPTEIARLQGARVVTASETEEGRRWAESRIKSLTGGDRVSARFMRQDFFEFTPMFKLLIAGNHKPGLRSVDEAIRRRFHLIPFSVTIPKKERDPELFNKLRQELPGILAWMIQGCLGWQQRGLAPPAVVADATGAYLEAEDSVAAWIEECCEPDSNAWERSASLFQSWTLWAEKAGEYAGSQRRFAERLENRGIEPMRRHEGRGFRGLRLRPDAQW